MGTSLVLFAACGGLVGRDEPLRTDGRAGDQTESGGSGGTARDASVGGAGGAAPETGGTANVGGDVSPLGGGTGGTAGVPGNPGTGGATSAGSGGVDAVGDTGGDSGAPGDGGSAGAAGQCPLGLSRCGVECVDLNTDTSHCGGCSQSCSTTNGAPFCTGGSCSIDCAPGYMDCSADENATRDGCETDGFGDVNNCGGCGFVCPPCLGTIPFCSIGQCGEWGCPCGAGNCNGDSADGCEVILYYDVNNCGACGNACSSGICSGGFCAHDSEGPSCAGGLDCGGVSCCQSLLVPGGTFPMGRSTEICTGCTDGCPSGMSCYDDEQPEHRVTVSSFYLDKYEVTVGRFRKFVEAFDAGWRPSEGEGANAAVELAQGLAAGTTGWQSEWDAELPTNRAEFEEWIACSSSYETWTVSAGANEAYPMNCVSWYEAFAFCIWDGGRLPTEGEWEYAAAGGEGNRPYPWGGAAPIASRANYSGGAYSPFVAVGSTPLGNGRWGHADLAGSMWEWVLDWYQDDYYADTETGCSDCANLTAASSRVIRGGYFYDLAVGLRAANRNKVSPVYHLTYPGLRCARSTP